jgi:hypothetical protein
LSASIRDATFHARWHGASLFDNAIHPDENLSGEWASVMLHPTVPAAIVYDDGSVHGSRAAALRPDISFSVEVVANSDRA